MWVISFAQYLFLYFFWGNISLFFQGIFFFDAVDFFYDFRGNHLLVI